MVFEAQQLSQGSHFGQVSPSDFSEAIRSATEAPCQLEGSQEANREVSEKDMFKQSKTMVAQCCIMHHRHFQPECQPPDLVPLDPLDPKLI